MKKFLTAILLLCVYMVPELALADASDVCYQFQAGAKDEFKGIFNKYFPDKDESKDSYKYLLKTILTSKRTTGEAVLTCEQIEEACVISDLEPEQCLGFIDELKGLGNQTSQELSGDKQKTSVNTNKFKTLIHALDDSCYGDADPLVDINFENPNIETYRLSDDVCQGLEIGEWQRDLRGLGDGDAYKLWSGKTSFSHSQCFCDHRPSMSYANKCDTAKCSWPCAFVCADSQLYDIKQDIATIKYKKAQEEEIKNNPSRKYGLDFNKCAVENRDKSDVNCIVNSKGQVFAVAPAPTAPKTKDVWWDLGEAWAQIGTTKTLIWDRDGRVTEYIPGKSRRGHVCKYRFKDVYNYSVCAETGTKDYCESFDNGFWKDGESRQLLYCD